MAHHSSDIMNDSLMQQWTKDLGLGATGKFPEGKLTEQDEGEIKIGVTSKDDKIIIAFGKKVNWVGLTKEQAADFAELLLKHSKQKQ